MPIPGIHHVTAIASDPQENLNFYSIILGLRLVKLTVNFDDPGTYHFYYGDYSGAPGTILTFFPWPGVRRGRHGTGQTTVTSFAIPRGSLGEWIQHLRERGIETDEVQERFGQQTVAFEDPDGLALELIESGGDATDLAIRGFHGITLSESGYESTAALLAETFGYQLVGQEANCFRYAAPSDQRGNVIDLLCQPDARSGSMGAGTVHHVAFRAGNEEEQKTWRTQLSGLGYNVTPVLDREYFHSIYFREPGGVLFEIATDPPGFTIDEPLEELGKHLKLPPWLEPRRAEIERILPKIRL